MNNILKTLNNTIAFLQKGGKVKLKNFSISENKTNNADNNLNIIISSNDLIGPPTYEEFADRYSNGFTEQYKDLPQINKNSVDKIAKKYNIQTKDIPNWYSSEEGRRILGGHYKGIPADGRVRHNDSPTERESEELTRKMHIAIMQGTPNSKNIPTRGYEPSKYDVPYILEKEQKIPGIGRVSMNAVDSIAKYAGQAGISMQEALGLFSQETKGGAIPYQNTGTKGVSSRALMNSNYHREYGIIPANYLVRDFEYDRLGHEQDRNIPPLLHAFKYYKAGKYNSGDPNHSSDVLREGEKVLGTKQMQNYLKQSPYAKGVKMYK